MRVIHSLTEIPRGKKIVLTIGNFDGVHRGHRKILRYVRKAAHDLQASSCVMTFLEHPRKVVQHAAAVRLLHSTEHKLTCLDHEDVDLCLLISFTESMQRLSALEFLRRFIDPRIIVKVVIGYDFQFGRNREGTGELVRAYCAAQKIAFSRVSALLCGIHPISSNRIRAFIAAGDFARARHSLGRAYSVFGTVVRGAAVGRTIGIPTANVKVESELFPPDGVYRVRIRYGHWARQPRQWFFTPRSRWFRGLAYWGPRPAFAAIPDSDRIIEVFIFRFTGDLYGKPVEIIFDAFERKPRQITTKESLQSLIGHDISVYNQRMKTIYHPRKG